MPFCIQTRTCRTAPIAAESTRRQRTDAETQTPWWCGRSITTWTICPEPSRFIVWPYRRRPHTSSGGRTSGFVPPTLGDRDGVRCTQDPSARGADRIAEQDTGIGQAGVLWFADGAFCGARVDARSGAQSRRGSGSAVLRLTLFALSNAAWRALRRSPPRPRTAFPQAILGEILQERCVSSRDKSNPRGLKRKISTHPLRPRKWHPTQRMMLLRRIRNR